MLITCFYIIEYYLTINLSTLELAFWGFWNSFWLEFFFLQIFIVYQIYKLFLEKNFFKMVITLLFFLILISIYLSLMQLELFACFLFLSEFILIVFFYCLFLHLNYTNKSIFYNNLTNLTFIFLLGLIFAVIFFLLNKKLTLLYNINDLFLVFIDIYSMYNTFFLNDLVFLFFIFYNYNTTLFFFIGLMLLVMTLILLYSVWLYVTFYLTRRFFFKSTLVLKINKVLWNGFINFFF